MRNVLAVPAVALLSLFAASCAGPRASAPAEAAATKPAEAAAAKPATAPGTAVVSIPVSGMHCGTCVSRVTAALQGVEGVLSAQTLLSEERAVVTYAPDRVAPAALVAAIRSAGYEPGEPVAQ